MTDVPLTGSGPLMALPGLLPLLAAAIGTRLHRPGAAVAAWWWSAGGFMLFALGVLYAPAALAAYPVLGAGLLVLARRRAGAAPGLLALARRRAGAGDASGLLDAGIVTVGAAALAWPMLIAPHVLDPELAAAERLVAVGHPLGALLLAGAAARLAFTAGPRTPALVLTVASVASAVAAGLAAPWPEACWIAACGLLAAAALHPSMRTLGEPVVDEALASRLRLVLVAGAALVAPAIALGYGVRSGNPDAAVAGAAALAPAVLVVARMAQLVRRQGRSGDRERVLARAGAALMSGPGRRQIQDIAVQAAVDLAGPGGVALLCRAAEGDDAIAVSACAGTLRLGLPPRLPVAVARRLLHAAWDGQVTVLPPGALAALGSRADTLGRAAAVAIPLPGRAPELLVAAGPGAAAAEAHSSLQALAAEVALALENAALTDDVHRWRGEARFGSLVRNAGDLVTVIAPDGTVSYQSPSVDALLGRSPEEVVGRPFEELVERSDHPLLQRLLAEDGGRDDGRRPPLECSLLHRDGRSLTFEILHANLLDDEHVGGIVLTCRDVSARRALEEQLAHQAFHDPLTKLANRAFFAERVRHALARARRERSGIAVAFLDLDDFKAINDTLGHGAGDEVLLEVAKRLASSIRTSDTASRFGGDEFALLLEDIDDVQDAADVAQRVLAALAMPMHVGHTELTVRSSMGLALADGAGDADELVHDADAAMYVAKRDGKGAYRIFEAAMQEGAMSRLELSADLEGAIAAGRLELHYQPIVRLGDGATVAVEALLRWHHPERGEIPPGEFIPLAEETGLIVPIGRWALREACRQARRMLDALPSGGAPALSVNLSLKQVLHRTLVSDVRETLLDLRLDPAALTLEITEAALMADADAAARRLGELRDLGVRIALDDFGAGWSSLSHLGRFPLDVLKLDRSLLRSGEPEGAGLAAALVAVGGALGLEVVAGGIEADDERERLADAGCPLGQGFLFAPPMDGDETLAHVVSRHPDAS